MSINRAVSAYKQELARHLSVWHLSAFGMNYIAPFGLAIIFGVIANTSGKTVALPVLLAFLIMLFTANSYIYMVKHNPVAGSLYSYVDALLGRKIGAVAGFILLLDYIFFPTSVAIGASYYLSHFFIHVSPHLLLTIYVLITGLINLLGIRILANVGLCFLIFAEILLVSCLIIFGHHVVANHHNLIDLGAFSFTSYKSLFMATTITVFGYLGFDAISTLAEEANRPSVDIPRAIRISIVLSATTMFLLTYFGTISYFDITKYVNDSKFIENGFFYIVSNAGGSLFSAIFTAGVVITLMLFNVVSTAAASRLLYGMGRDRVIPRVIFSKINKRFKTPHNNIILIVLIELIIGNFMTISSIAELINFGAICAFAILNYAVATHIFKTQSTTVKNCIQITVPIIGCLSMIGLMFLLQKITLILGLIWTILAIVLVLCNKSLKSPMRFTKEVVAKLEKKDIAQSSNLSAVIDLAINHPNLLKELQISLDYEHWNSGKILLSAIIDTQKESFLLAIKDGKLVGSIVAYNYNQDVSAAGLFYVKSEYRGEGYGALLTNAALKIWQNRAVICDAILMQTGKYAKMGLAAAYENRRFTWVAGKNISDTIETKYIISAKEYDIQKIIDFDEQHFYVRRETLIKYWVNLSNHGFIFVKDNIIQGLIFIIPSSDSNRVGPFFANNIEIAKDLLIFATNNLTGQLLSIDMPLINPNIRELIGYFDMVEGNMKTVRMHTKDLPIKNINQIYGHLSIELG